MILKPIVLNLFLLVVFLRHLNEVIFILCANK